MSFKIALAGNPNCGKTTLFNALTGSNQFVGNWPGVTVEKKEGKLKNQKDVIIMDLPGIYSLSPYTLEEVVTRNYLINEKPDVILNIIDGTNIERNLYLSTQLIELGIPVIMAINMMDIVHKNGDKIHIEKLSKKIGCEIVEISALKGTGISEVADRAIKLAQQNKESTIVHEFSSQVEEVLESIEHKISSQIPQAQRRFFAIKLLERDEKITSLMEIVPDVSEEINHIENIMDDDTESIITNERYEYISTIITQCYTKKNKDKLSSSDKIDKVVTNRWLALPIFAAIMFVVYYISISTVGTLATDWANDGVFGDGWHLLGVGTSDYNEASSEYDVYNQEVSGFINGAEEKGVNVSNIRNILENKEAEENVTNDIMDTNTIDLFTENSTVKNLIVNVDILDEEGAVIHTVDVGIVEFKEAISMDEPDPSGYGIWVPGVPSLIEKGLDAVSCADWLKGLILDGIVAGVGAVLGFVPQMLILFAFLAFLEACGYMARVAFIMDRIFRKFGLSGKSFIPMLIGSGCGVPGIMASRTIENDRDRKMTIMTTTFIPCSAKLPIIALITGALFGGAWWVAPSAYFVGIGAIISSGIILKKTKIFNGDPAPFVMELPSYHMPTVENILRSMWERASSFIKKAGTVILLSTIFVWFTTFFGWVDGQFRLLSEMEIDHSILAMLGHGISWIFIPLGWGDWKSAVAAITGLVAKENVVGTFGILFGYSKFAEDGAQFWSALAGNMTSVAAYSFLVFNLLCAPCFAAMGAIKREMNNSKWFWTAIGYQTGFAYVVALCIYQIGTLITTGKFTIGSIGGCIVLLGFIFLLLRPAKGK